MSSGGAAMPRRRRQASLGLLDLVRQLVPLSRQREQFLSLGCAAGVQGLPFEAARLGAKLRRLAHERTAPRSSL
jgi:hypothetical protein